MVGSGYVYENGSGDGNHAHATGVEREREGTMAWRVRKSRPCPGSRDGDWESRVER